MYPRLATILLASLAASGAGAQAAPDSHADSSAVIAVAQSLLRAISTRDTALTRRLMLPGAQLVSITDPAGAASASQTRSDSQFVAMLASSGPRLLERMWSPTAFVQGSVAVVRTPYDFHIDGVFSHCGVDVFTMVRARGEWRVSHVVYTTQRAGCASSPLGAPAM